MGIQQDQRLVMGRSHSDQRLHLIVGVGLALVPGGSRIAEGIEYCDPSPAQCTEQRAYRSLVYANAGRGEAICFECLYVQRPTVSLRSDEPDTSVLCVGEELPDTLPVKME